MLAFLLGSGRGSLPATHHYSYWGADLAICWRALAFTFISDLRTSSILQKQIPWQGQALKHLMSHPPFAFKHATHLFEKGSSSLWGKTPSGLFLLSAENYALHLLFNTPLWTGREQSQSAPCTVCSSRPSGGYSTYIRAWFRWIEIASWISVKPTLTHLLSFLSTGSLHWLLEL